MVNIKCKTFWSSCRFKIILMYLIFEQMRLPKKINLIQIIVPVKMVYHFNFKYYYRPNLSIQNSITLISFNVYEETRGLLLTGPLTPKLLFCVDFSCTFCLFLVSSLIWIVSVFFFSKQCMLCWLHLSGHCRNFPDVFPRNFWKLINNPSILYRLGIVLKSFVYI